VSHQQTTQSQLRAQQAQQFLQMRETQKRLREEELKKLQMSLQKTPTKPEPEHDAAYLTQAGGGGGAAAAPAAAAATAPTAPKEECKAIASYQAAAGHEVSIQVGESIKVVRKHPSGWWEGITASGEAGWFPSTYVTDVRPIQFAR
jgi:hypothetical protein